MVFIDMANLFIVSITICLVIKLLLNLVFYNCMKFLFICLFFIGFVSLSACKHSQELDFRHSLSGQVYVSDTMLYKDHSYILVRHSITQDFQVLHSPDCFCRYNRKFIIVKHSK